jgi:hypothetical protein
MRPAGYLALFPGSAAGKERVGRYVQDAHYQRFGCREEPSSHVDSIIHLVFFIRAAAVPAAAKGFIDSCKDSDINRKINFILRFLQ